MTAGLEAALQTIEEVNTPAATPSHDRIGINRSSLVPGDQHAHHTGSNVGFGSINALMPGPGDFKNYSLGLMPPPRLGPFNEPRADETEATAEVSAKKPRSKSPSKEFGAELDLFA